MTSELHMEPINNISIYYFMSWLRFIANEQKIDWGYKIGVECF